MTSNLAFSFSPFLRGEGRDEGLSTRFGLAERSLASSGYAVVAPPAALLGCLVRMRAGAHGPGARRDRFHDVVVAGAPADVAFELFPDGALVEIVAEAVHHVDR